MMKDKLHRLILGAALAVWVAAGDVNAQNFSADLDGVIFHDGRPLSGGDPIHLTSGEAFYIFDDPPGHSITGEENLPTFGGIQAYANDRGSFRAHLATPGSERGVEVEIQHVLHWERDYIKSDDATPFRFFVNPGLLRLIDSDTHGDTDLVAAWKLEAKVNGVTQFSVERELTGHGSFTSESAAAAEAAFAEAYRMTVETGPIPGGLSGPTPSDGFYSFVGAEYRTPSYRGTLDLSGIPTGATFQVVYELFAQTTAYGVDTLAESMSGDPLDYTGGVVLDYGDFGDALWITDFAVDNEGRSHAHFPSDPEYYYILCGGEDILKIDVPLAVKLGDGDIAELIDSRSAPERPRTFYQVKQVHGSVPLDLDGDLIDDKYELEHPAILNPLDPADALVDSDQDGRNALQEYGEGTDPEVADGGGPDDGSLYPAETFAIGEGNDLETADLNNDGIADLISFNAALFVSMGNADGSFAPPNTVAIPGGGFIGDITLARLNADDFPDVVFADEINNRVEVLFGDGIGGFVSDAKHDLGAAPRRAVVVRVNDDAHLDIVTANNVARSVSILLGNGDGTFQPPVTLDTENRPTDATAALLNDDAHPDLIVTLETGGAMAAVFLNNGDGTFAPKSTYPTGFSPQRVLAGDLDGDGANDVVTANQTADGVSVLLGQGDGTLLEAVDYPTGDNPRGFLLVDLDDDTDLDILVAHVGANYHAVLLNDGAGSFTNGAPAFTASDNHNCLFVDVDRDGRRDIVSLLGINRAMASRGLEDGRFDTREQFSFPPGQFTPRDFEVADVNEDGRPDVVISDQSQNGVDVLLAQPDGGFNLLSPVPVGEKVEGLAVARLDAGATLDLAVATQRPDFFPGNSSNQLHLLYGDGAGGFSAGPVVELHAQPNDVISGDFDGDGTGDVLVAFNATAEIQLFLSTATGISPQPPLDLGDAFGGAHTTRIIGDFNNDGMDDFAGIAHQGGPGLIQVRLGVTDEPLGQTQLITPSNNGSAQKLVRAEVSGDAIPDLVVRLTGAGQERLVFYPGNADGSFGAEQLLVDGYNGELAIADVNNDGLSDLLDRANIRLAEAGGGYAAPRNHHLEAGTLPVRVADMNGDGRPDLVSAYDLGDAVEILLHR